MARLLLLGGVDPSGGAGITVDAVVAALHGVDALPIAVALTVQDRRAFRSCTAVPVATWRAALDGVLADAPAQAIKIGLLADAATAHALADALAPLRGRVPFVVDPVLGATAGGLRADPALVAAYRERLVPLATLLTPNGPELDALFAGSAAAALAAGAAAVLHKGGHGDGAHAEDVLWRPGSREVFARPRLSIGPVRGTGCALASALAARLASGRELAAACRGAGDWLAALLRALGPAPADGLPRHLPFARAER